MNNACHLKHAPIPILIEIFLQLPVMYLSAAQVFAWKLEVHERDFVNVVRNFPIGEILHI